MQESQRSMVEKSIFLDFLSSPKGYSNVHLRNVRFAIAIRWFHQIVRSDLVTILLYRVKVFFRTILRSMALRQSTKTYSRVSHRLIVQRVKMTAKLFSALLNLSRLHILDLDHNDLTMLPAEISRMDSLETLLGKFDHFSWFSAQIGSFYRRLNRTKRQLMTT